MTVLPLPAKGFNVATFVKRSSIYGPGARFVIWFQGCALRCMGCWNKAFWSFHLTSFYTVDELFELICQEDGIDGVTLLGGEPLHQAHNLLKLLKKLRRIGLSTMLYTGFESEEINSDPVKQQVVEQSDIVICGRYLNEFRSTYLKWRGSSNQRIIINNEKYKPLFESLSEENQVEIHIGDDGEVVLIGYPDEVLRKEVLS